MSEWRKDCDCKVAGCVVNDITTSTARDGDNLRVIATFHAGPCCPKCYKPWKLDESRVHSTDLRLWERVQ